MVEVLQAIHQSPTGQIFVTITVTLTFDLQNNRGPLLLMANRHVNSKCSRPKYSQVIDRKPFCEGRRVNL